MKAAIVVDAGVGPRLGEFPDPSPSSGENRIKVLASSVSHVVKGHVTGRHYSAAGRFPFVAGMDGVGMLDDGSRVYFALPRAPYGSFAEYTVAARELCVPLPDGLDDLTAAAIANPGLSSWMALSERAVPPRRDGAHQWRDGHLRAPGRPDRASPRRGEDHRDRP